MNKLVLALLCLCPLITFSQTAKEKGLESIKMQDSKLHIGILASDSLEGRRAGEKGGRMAAEYIKNVLINEGLKPWKDSIFHPFNITLEIKRMKGGMKMMRRVSESEQLSADKDYKTIYLNNILFYIEGENKNEIVAIGAHYDHMGIHPDMEGDNIYNGADDNASGTSAVLQIAKAFIKSGQKPKRSVLFALWDGEEMGLLGSWYFMQNYTDSTMPRIKGYINLDMIGRNRNEVDAAHHMFCNYTSWKPVFKEWINTEIEKYNLNLTPEFRPSEKPRGGSDHTPFAEKNIPIIYFHTGIHPDYHKPSDHSDKINYDKAVSITKLTFLNLWNMANEENY